MKNKNKRKHFEYKLNLIVTCIRSETQPGVKYFLLHVCFTSLSLRITKFNYNSELFAFFFTSIKQYGLKQLAILMSIEYCNYCLVFITSSHVILIVQQQNHLLRLQNEAIMSSID